MPYGVGLSLCMYSRMAARKNRPIEWRTGLYLGGYIYGRKPGKKPYRKKPGKDPLEKRRLEEIREEEKVIYLLYIRVSTHGRRY